MASSIQYNPSIGRRKFNEAVKSFHFSDSDEFLDFTVQLALISYSNRKLKKLVSELMDEIHKSSPLHFVKPSAQEDKEIRQRFEEIKKGKSVQMSPIKS